MWRVEDLRRVIGDGRIEQIMGAVDHEDPTGNDAVAAPRDLEAEAELLRRARRFVGQGVLPRAGGVTAVREAERVEVVDGSDDGSIGRLDGGSIEGRLGSGLVEPDEQQERQRDGHHERHRHHERDERDEQHERVRDERGDRSGGTAGDHR